MATQAGTEATGWMAFDLGRAMRLLHSLDQGVVRRTLRRLHVRYWHMPARRLQELLRHSGAPTGAINLVPEIVESCAVCRMWTRPTARSMVATRLATMFNERVQWDILFHKDWMISHLLDECTRWLVVSVLQSKSAESILEAITTTWLRPHGAMKILVADQEGGLVSDAAAVWADRWGIQLKAEATHNGGTSS